MRRRSHGRHSRRFSIAQPVRSDRPETPQRCTGRMGGRRHRVLLAITANTWASAPATSGSPERSRHNAADCTLQHRSGCVIQFEVHPTKVIAQTYSIVLDGTRLPMPVRLYMLKNALHRAWSPAPAIATWWSAASATNDPRSSTRRCIARPMRHTSATATGTSLPVTSAADRRRGRRPGRWAYHARPQCASWRRLTGGHVIVSIRDDCGPGCPNCLRRAKATFSNQKPWQNDGAACVHQRAIGQDLEFSTPPMNACRRGHRPEQTIAQSAQTKRPLRYV